VDVIGAMTEKKDIRSVNTKRGDSVSVRDIIIADDSNASVQCTLWGRSAESFDHGIGTIVCFKGVKVGDFNGVSLSSMGSTQISVSPDISRGHELKAWYDGGNATNATSLSTGGGGGNRGPKEKKTLGQIKDENLGTGEKPDWFETRAMVSFIKHDGTWMYVAAPESKKKCIDNGDGTWTCEAENRTYQNHEVIRRYILSLTLNDHTGVQWFNAFDDAGVKLLGMTADELHRMKEMDGGDVEFEKAFARANFSEVNVLAKAKYETYNDESRLKCTIQSVEPINYAAESTKMLDSIEQLLARA
jgi:replication factor A1